MSDIYTRIIGLCEKRGIKGGKMCTEIGVSKSLLTDMKMGRKSGLSAINAHKIATYFGVSVGYLLGEDTEANQEIETNITYMQAANKLSEILCDDDFIEMYESYRTLSSKNKQAVKSLIEGLK